MERIKMQKINKYTSKVYVAGKEITLVDTAIKEQVEARRLQMINFASKCLEFIGSAICVITFIYIVGIVGHSDFCIEMHIDDEWSTTTYLIYAARSLICMALGAVFIKIGSVIQDTIYKED